MCVFVCLTWLLEQRDSPAPKSVGASESGQGPKADKQAESSIRVWKGYGLLLIKLDLGRAWGGRQAEEWVELVMCRIEDQEAGVGRSHPTSGPWRKP